MANDTMIDTSRPAATGSESCGRSGHPLEAIAYFRRFKASPLRDLLYTFIWNSVFVVAFTIFGQLFEPQAPLLRMLWVNFVIANCIGYLIHLGFSLGHGLLGARLHGQSFAIRTLFYSTVSIAGVFGGYWLGFTLLSWQSARQWVMSAQGATAVLLLGLMISLVLAVVFYARERQAMAEADFQSERARVAAAERHAKVAELKLLEAQLEPHFLYNTLANVISLIDANPPAAKHMVERLIDYLRRAAVAADGAEVTLGRQLELLRAYLDLVVLRMGSRLAYRIDVPAELLFLPLPPMLLQPLVENAIKHGLEPKVGGGEVVVTARRNGDELILAVADNGAGVSATRPPGSTGLGLANLRERLSALYGAHARLTLEDAHPGTRVSVGLPVSNG